jgi:hypothetical protein
MSPYKGKRGGRRIRERDVTSEAVRERFEDVLLMALKMEEGAVRQGK